MTPDHSLPSDLGNFGYIQIDHTIDLLKAIKEGYPRDFIITSLKSHSFK